MSQLIFITVGTSIIQNNLQKSCEGCYKHEIEGKNPIDVYSNNLNIFKNKLLQKIISEFDHAINNFPNEQTNVLSAEIITLYIMMMSEQPVIDKADDNIAMLYSQTLESKIAAEINRTILIDKLGFKSVELYQLNGINGRDGCRFTESVNNHSISGLLDQIANRIPPYEKKLFCFSGGYKGLIPVISTYSKNEFIDMYCLYEKADSLIVYPWNSDDDVRFLAYK